MWQDRIESLAKRLGEMVDVYAGGRWPHWPDDPADKQITAEIAHHLSPFREMVQFPRLRHLAHNTIDAAIAWKIRDNRLLTIAADFGNSDFNCPGSVALALQYGFRTRKARRCLTKLTRKILTPHRCNFLGGQEQCLALFCQAHLTIDPALAVAILNDYFRHRLVDGGLGNPAATVAFVDLLLAMEYQHPRITSEEKSIRLEQPTVDPVAVQSKRRQCLVLSRATAPRRNPGDLADGLNQQANGEAPVCSDRVMNFG